MTLLSVSGVGLYGLDNFYYRRFQGGASVGSGVYTDLIISTIVDVSMGAYRQICLYGLDNFYYRRFSYTLDAQSLVYTDLIISTIVDMQQMFAQQQESIRT